jgi:hypothetical protein
MNSRDPIMNDETFSLRFGNPIQVIHDSQPVSFPKHHDSSDETKDTHNDDATSTTHTRNNMVRDVASFADFYHSKEGRVDEVDHE